MRNASLASSSKVTCAVVCVMEVRPPEACNDLSSATRSVSACAQWPLPMGSLRLCLHLQQCSFGWLWPSLFTKMTDSNGLGHETNIRCSDLPTSTATICRLN